MKTIFDQQTRDVLIERIGSLDTDSKANWGKMNVYQMTMHCCIWEAWVQGKNNPVYKQSILGKIFGKRVLRSITKDDKPLDKNIPTSKGFLVEKKSGELETQKTNWIALMSDYQHFSNDAFIHDFFGKMTKDQIGILAYKHSDHHLRQFGV